MLLLLLSYPGAQPCHTLIANKFVHTRPEEEIVLLLEVLEVTFEVGVYGSNVLVELDQLFVNFLRLFDLTLLNLLAHVLLEIRFHLLLDCLDFLIDLSDLLLKVLFELQFDLFSGLIQLLLDLHDFLLHHIVKLLLKGNVGL